MKNYDKAVKIYQKGGQYAIYDAVKKGEIKADSWRDCLPCEERTPHEGNTCLVCGTENGLMETVLIQIKKDVLNCDLTAIEEMLKFVPTKTLEAFISEAK